MLNICFKLETNVSYYLMILAIIIDLLKMNNFFFLDAVCALDSKLNPINLDKSKTKSPEIHTIALMLTGFHDTCRGCHNEPNGITVFNIRLAKSLGYKVLIVPYTELGTRETLVNRVQYLKENLKNLLSDP